MVEMSGLYALHPKGATVNLTSRFPKVGWSTTEPPPKSRRHPLFRRTKSEDAVVPAQTPLVREGGKGRPTPTRREAEAAARARARTPKSKKEANRVLRERRNEQNVRMRQGMNAGDERYLPVRDQGKVRRFARDRIDSRLCMAELLLPLLLVIMGLQYSGNPTLQDFSNRLWGVTILLVFTDTTYLTWRVRREAKTRFPDESTKGLTLYTMLRSLQLRFMRLPKRNVKLGQKLPDRY